MNDTFLIAGGVIAIIVIAGGGGWLYRTAFRKGANSKAAAKSKSV